VSITSELHLHLNWQQNSMLRLYCNLLFSFSSCVNSYYRHSGRPAQSAAMPVLFLLSAPKIGFSPTGATFRPNKHEIWHGGADHRPCAKCYICQGRNVGMQPPILSKFRILAINLPLRGNSFSVFL